MDVDTISKIFKEYGVTGSFMFVIILFFSFAIKNQWFSDLFSKISEKIVEKFMKNKTRDISNLKKITESDIKNHDIFNYIDFWTYSKVPTFQFSTEYRTVVFRKYLTIYLKNYKRNIEKFVQSSDYQNMDEATLHKNMLNLINLIIYDYEKEATEIGIPKIVIEKMKIRNNDTLTLTLDLIEGVCDSQFYNSEKNFIKVYSIMNILLSILENTISNSESVCNSINGQLKGLTFDGKTEP
jgi:hypothetical protein